MKMVNLHLKLERPMDSTVGLGLLLDFSDRISSFSQIYFSDLRKTDGTGQLFKDEHLKYMVPVPG
jgi:hypothetical protein